MLQACQLPIQDLYRGTNGSRSFIALTTWSQDIVLIARSGLYETTTAFNGQHKISSLLPILNSTFITAFNREQFTIHFSTTVVLSLMNALGSIAFVTVWTVQALAPSSNRPYRRKSDGFTRRANYRQNPQRPVERGSRWSVHSTPYLESNRTTALTTKRQHQQNSPQRLRQQLRQLGSWDLLRCKCHHIPDIRAY
jgi:hypothetical protein